MKVAVPLRKNTFLFCDTSCEKAVKVTFYKFQALDDLFLYK